MSNIIYYYLLFSILTYIIGKGELFQSLLDGLLILTSTASSSVLSLPSSLSTSTNALETMGDMNHLLNTKILKNTTKLIGKIIYISYVYAYVIYTIYIYQYLWSQYRYLPLFISHIYTFESYTY